MPGNYRNALTLWKGLLACVLSLASTLPSGCGGASSPAGGGACRQAADCGTHDSEDYCKWSSESRCGQVQALGVCASRPKECPSDSDPVCGCDGLTYDSACRAAQLGVSVAKQGACALGAPGQEGRPCAGLDQARCEPGLFCSYLPETQCGSLSKRGTCLSSIRTCTGPSDPVCGCDGRNYQSPCHAANAGVSVARAGDCSTVPGGIQSLCGLATHVPCDPGLYCMYAPRSVCGLGDETGTCQPQPTTCSNVQDPVCGCDGKTHLNPCRAAREGISIEYDGFCRESKGTGIECDASGRFDCSQAYYCNYPPQTSCGQLQDRGICEMRLNACAEDDEDDVEDTEGEETGGEDSKEEEAPQEPPVCGCDNRTYASACIASVRGISIAHQGACATPNPKSQVGEVCSLAPPLIECADGLFCSYTHRHRCNFAATLGRCEPIPTDCPDEDDFVCGCDKQDYRNACEANKAGVSIDYPWKCGEDGVDDED